MNLECDIQRASSNNMKSESLSQQVGRLPTQPNQHPSTNGKKPIVTNTNNYVFASALIDAVHEPILILDKDLTIQAANSAFFKTFKLTSRELMQRNLKDFIPRNSQLKRLINRLQKLHTMKTFREFEIRYRFAKIGERILLINAKQINFNSEQSDLILLSIEDVTQRKLIEQQKDDFVGYVTHELKTPLTSLSAFIQILQGYHQKKNDKRSQFLVSKVASQVERLTHLLTSFNNVYKAQNGMLKINKTQFDLNELVTDTVETFQYTTATHMITIEGSIKKQIRGDKERIRQVLVNLLINAIKYSPTADMILVKLKEESKRVVVSVEDFGMGIPQSQQTHIFERFFRVKSKEKYNVKGLGLGLYITREIVNAHGGKLWVESTEGKGSTFSFSLPIK